jgi:uncharacterized protein
VNAWPGSNARLRPSLILLAAALWMGVAPGATALEVPYLTGRVVDAAEILSPAGRERISGLLKAHEDRTTNQLAVLTVPSLAGDNIEDFAARVFEAWRLGQAGKDNGLLVVVAVQDRRMRIEVGYGLEGTLTDLAAGRIIRNVMTPRFSDGDYDAGIEEGVLAVIAILEGRGAIAGDAQGASTAGPPSGFHMEGPDMSLMERILIGAFVFGIIGLFTIIGVVTPGVGWFLYLFLIPFWAMFPIVVVGVKGAFVMLATYLVAYPAAKLLLPRTAWYRRASEDLKTKGRASIGGFTFRSGGGSGGSSRASSWSSGSSGFSSSSGFSGGGGRSGGGGASGGW